MFIETDRAFALRFRPNAAFLSPVRQSADVPQARRVDGSNSAGLWPESPIDEPVDRNQNGEAAAGVGSVQDQHCSRDM